MPPIILAIFMRGMSNCVFAYGNLCHGYILCRRGINFDGLCAMSFSLNLYSCIKARYFFKHYIAVYIVIIFGAYNLNRFDDDKI